MDKRCIVKQHDIKDCGVCCLESIIKYYNGFIPLETLRLDTKTNSNGTSAYNLIKAARKYGFNAFGMKEIDILNKNIILPAIAHIETKKGFNHFIVIYKINKKYVYVMDPAYGYKKMTIAQFSEEWTNIILVFKPYMKIPLYQLNNSLKKIFIQIISKEKSVIFKIIVIDIFLTFISIILSYYFQITISLIESSYFNSVIFLVIVFLILNIFKIVFNYLKNDLSIYLNKNIDLFIIPDFISHIFMLPLNVISSRTTGEILTRVDELNNLKELFSEIFITLILNSFLVFFSMFFLYSISAPLFFILCIEALIYILVGIFYSPILYRKINDNIDLHTEFNSLLGEKVQGLETIKNANIINQTVDDLVTSYSDYQKNTFEYSRFFNVFVTLKSIIYDIGLFIITSYGFYLISSGNLSLLALITFNSLLLYFIEPIQSFVDIIPKFYLIKVSVNKVMEFLDIKQENLGKNEYFVKGDIKFRNITFSYDDFNEVLSNESLDILANEHVVIKGDTGCGKSTMMKMLNRSIDDYKGNIYISEINIKDYSLYTIRKNILYVSQREIIFSDSILNNITLKKNVSLKELNYVLKITKVEEIINKKALRLSSMLYDGGFNLSGGERQRIVLARAILMKPKILILDESLSEVDENTESSILESIDNYLRNTTIIYITHTQSNVFKKVIEVG